MNIETWAERQPEEMHNWTQETIAETQNAILDCINQNTGEIDFEQMAKLAQQSSNIRNFCINSILKSIENQKWNYEKQKELIYKLIDYFNPFDNYLLERIRERVWDHSQEKIDFSLLPSLIKLSDEQSLEHQNKIIDEIKKHLPYIDEPSIEFYLGYIDYKLNNNQGNKDTLEKTKDILDQYYREVS